MNRRGRGFGRKQILQLNNFHKGETYVPSTGFSGQGSLGLVSYGDDSDEEEKAVENEAVPEEAPPTPPELPVAEPEPPKVPEPVIGAVENGKPGLAGLGDMDDKLADFLAEIKSMDDASDNVDGVPISGDGAEGMTGGAPPPPPAEQDSSSSEDSEEEPEILEPKAPTTDWEHCLDDGTQCYYYWNTVTNAVTWEIPPEYSQYLLQVKEYNENLVLYKLKVKERLTRIEEKSKIKQMKRKVNGKKRSKVVPSESGPMPEIGPRLPPGMTGPEGPEMPSQFEGPQLPSKEQTLLQNRDPDFYNSPAENLKKDYKDFIKFVGSKASKVESEPANDPSELIGPKMPERPRRVANGSQDSDSDEDRPKPRKKRVIKDFDPDMDLDDLDDIDRQLELALESKKEELQKLDDQDSGKGKRKAKEFKKKPVKESDDDEPPIKKKSKDFFSKKKLDREDVKLKAEVSNLADLVTDKLEFLEISRKGLSKLQVLLVEIETRLTDWRENAMPASYLLTKLEDAEKQLEAYEESAAPPGWSCHWDRSYRRYFYYNTVTGETQWDYPDEPAAPPKAPQPPAHPPPPKETTRKPRLELGAEESAGIDHMTSMLRAVRDPNNQDFSNPPPPPPPEPSSSLPAPPLPSTAPGSQVANGSVGAYSNYLAAPPPPPPDEPPPPGTDPAPPPPPQPVPVPVPPPGLLAPPPPPPPVSPPPPPPGTSPPPQSPEEVEMDCTDSIDPMPQQPPMMSSPPPADLVAGPAAPGYPGHEATIVAAPVLNVASALPSISAPPSIHSVASSSGPSTPGQSPPHQMSSDQPSGTTSPAPVPAAAQIKKKKKKEKIGGSLALKKKNFPSLVQKWQQIQEEVGRETKKSEETESDK